MATGTFPSSCDILKIADNELEFMTGETNLDKGAAALRRQYPNIRLFNVTAGPEGSCAYYEDKRVFVPACKLGGTIETTGAGDTFCACVLNFVLEHGLDGLVEEDLTAIAGQYNKEKSRGSSWAISGMGGYAFRWGPEIAYEDTGLQRVGQDGYVVIVRVLIS